MEKTKNRDGLVRAFKPPLGPSEARAVSQALASRWLGTGIYTRLFEAALAREAGTPFALATNSGTAALHLALKAADVSGGEVITTPVTSVATSHAILYNGAVPVFCDVERETGNIDPSKIEELVTPRTRAVVVVHLGHACDMDPILDIARRRRLLVVEDACAGCAVGGFYKERPLGSLGDLGCFSFGRFKGISTLDGGAVVHGREERQERLLRLRRLGHEEGSDGLAGVAELGFHYRMNDLAAALGLAQLKRKMALLGRLDAISARYREGVSGLAFIENLQPKEYSRGARAYAAFRVKGGRRDPLRRFLKKNGVQVNDCLFPNHLYELYKPYRRSLPAAEKYCAETLHLPYYPDLTDEEIDRILEIMRKFKG